MEGFELHVLRSIFIILSVIYTIGQVLKLKEIEFSIIGKMAVTNYVALFY